MWSFHSFQPQQTFDVDQWRQEVADATQQPESSKAHVGLPSPRKLRSSGRLGGSGLRSTSGNRQKLPPSATVPLVTGEPALKRRRQMNVPKRGRGRPRGSGRGGLGRGTDSNQSPGIGPAGDRGKPQQYHEQEQQDNTGDADFVPAGTKKVPLKDPDDPQSSTVPSGKSRSRSRSRSRSQMASDFQKPISVSQVDLTYLASCTPSVTPISIEQVRWHFSEEVSGPTKTLYDKMMKIPPNIIPPSLKSVYDQQADTPRKSRDAPSDFQYATSSKEFFPPALLRQIAKKAGEVLNDAAWNARNQADEDQWSLVVYDLLKEVAEWPRAQVTRVLRTTRCTISPSDLYTRMPGGRQPLNYDAEDTSRTTETTSTQNADRKISKMVDWSLGLDIDYMDSIKIDKAFRFCDDREHSLNQSRSFIKRVPIFLDLELKKILQMRDPEVQLAIWKSGWLLKARHHRWDTSLPMPGITVMGHEWSYYLFMAAGDGLFMLGPYKMGSTADLDGVWHILCRLNILFDWGTTTYYTWFREHIMSWAEKTDVGDMNALSLRSGDNGQEKS